MKIGILTSIPKRLQPAIFASNYQITRITRLLYIQLNCNNISLKCNNLLFTSKVKSYTKSEFLQDYVNYNSRKGANETYLELCGVISDKILSMDIDSAKKFILENSRYVVYLKNGADDKIRSSLTDTEMQYLLENWPSEKDI